MSTLRLGTPAGLDAATEQAFDEVLAPLQTWAGTIDGFGKWQGRAFVAADFRVDGAGNSWSFGSTSGNYARVAWTLLGETAIVEIDIVNSSLTIATSVSAVYVRLPADLQVVNPAGMQTAAWRYTGKGWMIHGGAGESCTFLVGVAGAGGERHIAILRDNVGAFATDGSFCISGSIAFKVKT